MKEKSQISSLGSKILVANAFLYSKKKIANAEGLFKILTGVRDEDTALIQKELIFGSIVSLKSKRLKITLHHLVQNHYLRQTYQNGDYYFINTDLGDDLAENAKIIVRRRKKEKIEVPPIIDL